MTKIYLYYFWLSLSFLTTIVEIEAANPDKIIKAKKITSEIKVDGKLDETPWAEAQKANGFVQTEPIVGKLATFDTDSYFLYDNNAVYIGARMHDPEPDKILTELSLRDNSGNTDRFSVFFDTYNSGINGFLFEVTASGVQIESVVANNDEDTNWNAIWESSVRIDEHGWTVEIKIPYSSLRFPSTNLQNWNINFGREIRRFRETSNWSPVNPAIAGFVQQSGSVTHIENIKPPVRLSLTPYISGYVNTDFAPNAAQKWKNSTAYSAGLDLKYGISDAFTLDMTLVPDFGQVISDRQVLNLTPFEIYFEENRQFFTEGTELFNKGNLFYSRRVGEAPLYYNDLNDKIGPNETVINNPSISQLYNATKISGRTTGGTGIGAFNALVGESFATVADENGNERKIRTNPLTNYNAIVIDQNLKNNSFVSFINTNVNRSGEDYDANVTGGFFNFRTKDQVYALEGNAVISQKYTKTTNDVGKKADLSFAKISGNWTYGTGGGFESDNYDPNDMGFIFNANEKYLFAELGYVQYKPKKEKIQRYSFNGSVNTSRLYKPDVYSDLFITGQSFILWKSRFAIGVNTRIEPIATRDYFEPRLNDFSKYVAWSSNYSLGGFVSSDYRKPFAYDIRANYRTFMSPNRENITATIAPRFRFSDRFSTFVTTNITSLKYEPGWVNKRLINLPIVGLGDNDIMIGHRNRLIIENSITSRYSFNSLMSINMRLRHYWDKVRYQEFGRLDDIGFMDLLAFDGNRENGEPIYDRNVNIFNIDLQYNWRFAPGSDIIFVWKNQIINSDKRFERDYAANLGGLFEANQTNSFSIRVLYFLDYLYLFPRKEV